MAFFQNAVLLARGVTAQYYSLPTQMLSVADRLPICRLTSSPWVPTMKLLSFLSSLLLFICPFAPGTLAAEPSFEEEATRKLRDLASGDSSGVAVLVSRDGKIVFQGGFGYADLAKKTPVTPETKFRIGSVSKQFTAAAVLRLAEEGKLSLDDS